MTNLVVLPITMANAPQTVELIERGYELSNYKSKPFDPVHVRRGLDDAIRLGHSILLMVYHDSDMHTPIGFVRARVDRVMFYDAPAIGSCTFFVDPARNKKGAAIALMEAFEQHAKQVNAEYVDVQITAGIKVAHTVALLDKLGYTALGGNFRKALDGDSVWVQQHKK